MGRLSGKRALMTGAGGRTGGDLSRAFAREGADLILTTRTPSKLDTLAAEIRHSLDDSQGRFSGGE